MGEPDTESWLEASRSYATLRRRYWRCFFGMPVSLIVYLVIGLPLSLLGEALKMNPYVTYLLLSSFSIVWVRVLGRNPCNLVQADWLSLPTVRKPVYPDLVDYLANESM